MPADREPGSLAAWTQASEDLPAEVPPPDVRYSAGGELGRGGMGVVDAATDAWLEREVARKRPHADLTDAQRSRLMREARITARLAHPGIVPIYDVGVDEQGPFYTMPVLVGRTLEAHVAAGEDSRAALVRALSVACRAVSYAHTRGIVHRDLKPANLLLGQFGEVWVLDWGVAHDPEEPDRAVVGTPGFQSPEQLGGEPVGPPSDVWSLGATLAGILGDDPEPELGAVARRCHERLPGARYAHAGELADELDRWLDGNRVRAHRYSAREVVWRQVLRWRAPIAVAAAAGLALLTLGAVAFEDRRVERDRALAAEQESERARQRADASLSVSLAQQAHALWSREVRPEAEVLAARSLELTENALARGVLMGWHGAPRPRLASSRDLPCARPFPAAGGRLICADDVVRVLGADGRPEWSAAAPAPTVTGLPWVGGYRSGRLFEDGTLLLLRQPNVLEVWSRDQRVAVYGPLESYLRLTSGDIPAILDRHRVGTIDTRTGAIRWSEALCDEVETAWVGRHGALVACKAAEIYLGTATTLRGPLPVPGSVSAVTWSDAYVLGTFQGDLLIHRGDEWTRSPSGVGAPQQLEAVPDGRILVLGERGGVRLWSARDGVDLGALPGRSEAIGVDAQDAITIGADVRRYPIPPDAVPVRFDRSAHGGLAFLAASPSGATLLAGSADGDVVSWAATGRETHLAAPTGHIARAGALLDDATALYTARDSGLVRHILASGERAVIGPQLGRRVAAVEGGFALLPYTPEAWLWRTDWRSAPLPAPPLAITHDRPLWVADEAGGVHRAGAAGFERQLTLERPAAALARVGARLFLAEGRDVVARDVTGAEQWRWTGSADLTALDASERWVVVGDRDGRLTVLDPDGAVLGAIPAHQRRISDVVVRGDVLYTGSWDGTARRWGLGAADADVTALARDASAWGIDVDQALTGGSGH